MEQRTVERFRKRAVLIHWVNAVFFLVLMISGGLMLFDMVGFDEGHRIREIHRVTAIFLLIVPLVYSFLDPAGVIGFVRETFRWSRDDIVWLKSVVPFYFGRRVRMPAQGYLNGDQRLWQLTVVLAGATLALTGIALWFFKLNLPILANRWIAIIHGLAFLAVSFMFLIHFYIASLHPNLEESLSSMIDGMVTPSYAQQHHGKWYDGRDEEENNSVPTP